MIRKFGIVLTIAVLSLALIVPAVPAGAEEMAKEGDLKNVRKKVEVLRAWRLTEELNLDEETSARLFPAMRQVHRAHGVRVSTSDLNRVAKDAFDRNPPPSLGKKHPKIYYCTQVHNRPPHFALFTNLDRKPHFSWTRYMENVLREAFSLEGVPFRVMIRGRKS